MRSTRLILIEAGKLFSLGIGGLILILVLLKVKAVRQLGDSSILLVVSMNSEFTVKSISLTLFSCSFTAEYLLLFSISIPYICLLSLWALFDSWKEQSQSHRS